MWVVFGQSATRTVSIVVEREFPQIGQKLQRQEDIVHSIGTGLFFTLPIAISGDGGRSRSCHCIVGNLNKSGDSGWRCGRYGGSYVHLDDGR